MHGYLYIKLLKKDVKTVVDVSKRKGKIKEILLDRNKWKKEKNLKNKTKHWG